MGALAPPPLTSEIYGFQEVFRPNRVLSPPLDEFLNTPLVVNRCKNIYYV